MKYVYYRTFDMFCVSVSNAILRVWPPENSFVHFTFCVFVVSMRVQWLYSVCAGDGSFAIQNPLVRVARLLTHAKHAKNTVYDTCVHLGRIEVFITLKPNMIRK